MILSPPVLSDRSCGYGHGQYYSTTEITKLFAPLKKRSISFEFSICSCGHLERLDGSCDISLDLAYTMQSCFAFKGVSKQHKHGKIFNTYFTMNWK